MVRLSHLLTVTMPIAELSRRNNILRIPRPYQLLIAATYIVFVRFALARDSASGPLAGPSRLLASSVPSPSMHSTGNATWGVS